jgi:2-isopropylmalate synthase
MRKAMGTRHHYFDLKGFRVISQKTSMDEPSQDEATIRIVVGSEGEVHTAALGEGPVNALDKALRKALTRFYPNLKNMVLTDYKVRVLAGEHGTGAQVRVLIQSRDEDSEWGTVGVSHDILEASWQALVDSITYKLMKDAKGRE